MNLIDAWKQAKSSSTLYFVTSNGDRVEVVKRGTFFNAVRLLMEHISEQEILSEGWRVQ